MTKYLRDRPFLIVDFIERPKPNVDTKKAGWSKDRENITLYEMVRFADRINSRDLVSKVIIDVTEAAVIKNSLPKTDEEILEYYIGRYSDKIKEAITAWADKKRISG